MKGILWSLGYMIAGAIFGVLLCEDDDPAGEVFVETFLWPIPAAIIVLGIVWDLISMGVDGLMLLLEGEGQK